MGGAPASRRQNPTRMRRSRYTSLVTDFPRPGQHLAFHWLTQSMAVLDNDLRGVIGAGGRFTAAQVPSGLLEQIVDMGLVVDDAADERDDIETWFRRASRDLSTLKVMVMTTYDCNFACSYCVEEGVKRPAPMGGSVPGRTVEWVQRQLEFHASEGLSLNFYGGEPLLNMPALERVAIPLRAYSRARGLAFRGSVTTNGSLLDTRNAERLLRAGITRVKVTLDGDRPAHDARRFYAGGRGSFDTIIGNLRGVADLLDVYVSGNLGDENRDAVAPLLDFLDAEGLLRKLHGISFGSTSRPARDGFGAHADAERSVASAGTGGQRGPAWICDDVLTHLLGVQQELIRRRLPARRSTMPRLCMLNQRDNGVIVDPCGRLYKCPALVGHEAFSVGSIDGDDCCCEHLRPYPDELDECMDCRWFPVCGGGCRFVSFLETGDIRRRCCIGGFLDAHGDDLIKLEYAVSAREDG